MSEKGKLGTEDLRACKLVTGRDAPYQVRVHRERGRLCATRIDDYQGHFSIASRK